MVSPVSDEKNKRKNLGSPSGSSCPNVFASCERLIVKVVQVCLTPRTLVTSGKDSPSGVFWGGVSEVGACPNTLVSPPVLSRGTKRTSRRLGGTRRGRKVFVGPDTRGLGDVRSFEASIPSPAYQVLRPFVTRVSPW